MHLAFVLAFLLFLPLHFFFNAASLMSTDPAQAPPVADTCPSWMSDQEGVYSRLSPLLPGTAMMHPSWNAVDHESRVAPSTIDPVMSQFDLGKAMNTEPTLLPHSTLFIHNHRKFHQQEMEDFGRQPFNSQEHIHNSPGLVGPEDMLVMNETLRCKQCDKVCDGREKLIAHLQSHLHKKFACPTCHKTFSRNGSLKIHMQTHTGRRPFVCPSCAKAFTQRGSLTSHLRVHTGEKPFVCPECSKSFSQGSSLRIHQRTHTGEKPFACPICDKKFAQRSKVTRHLRVHSTEQRLALQSKTKQAKEDQERELLTQQLFLLLESERAGSPSSTSTSTSPSLVSPASSSPVVEAFPAPLCTSFSMLQRSAHTDGVQFDAAGYFAPLHSLPEFKLVPGLSLPPLFDLDLLLV